MGGGEDFLVVANKFDISVSPKINFLFTWNQCVSSMTCPIHVTLSCCMFFGPRKTRTKVWVLPLPYCFIIFLTRTRKPAPSYTKTRTKSQCGVSCLFRLPAPRFEKTRPKVRVFPFAIVYVLICAFSLLNHQDSRKPAPRFEKTRPKVRETPPQGASFPFRTQIRQN